MEVEVEGSSEVISTVVSYQWGGGLMADGGQCRKGDEKCSKPEGKRP